MEKYKFPLEKVNNNSKSYRGKNSNSYLIITLKSNNLSFHFISYSFLIPPRNKNLIRYFYLPLAIDAIIGSVDSFVYSR